MTENKEILTLEKFHEALHKDIDKPVKDFRKEWNEAHRRHIKVHTGAHKAEWAKATVLLDKKIIIVRVNLNFKKNGISDVDYENLKYLTLIGIDKYWSRRIEVAGSSFMVWVQGEHNYVNAIPIDLYVETDKNNYARSMNPTILGIDASFIYNKGHFGNKERADADFMLVAAHEFGHSVLMYAGGLSLSWGHKGSTNIVTQSVKSSTPEYPVKGSIDLMKYYNQEKVSANLFRRVTDSTAMEIDVKRLIWGAQVTWSE